MRTIQRTADDSPQNVLPVISAPNGYLSIAEVSVRLQQLESKHDLLRHKLDGWCVWPLLRISLSWVLGNVPADEAGVGISKRELLPLVMSDLARLLWLKRARIVLKAYSSAHMEFEAGRRKDVFFDDLLQAAGGHFKIEELNNRFHLNPEPYFVPSDLTTAAITIIGGKLARWRPPPGIEDISTQISRCLKEELGIASYTPQYIASVLSRFHWQKRLFRIVLGRIKPRCLLLASVCDYHITAAARELGVKVIEFQHGLTHRHHPGNSWSRYAVPYKASMPLPNRMLLYGSYWQRELAVNGFWNDELYAVGSVRVDSYRRQSSQRRDDLCTMVVTPQGIDTERLIAFLVEFVRLAEGRLKYRIHIKMHPHYQADTRLFDEALGGNSNVRLVGGAEPPTTFELLKQAHLHLSIFSTCHYEALALGVPTLIIPFTGSENVVHLYESGHAFFPQTPMELLDLVLRWRELRVPEDVGGEYFKPGAMENIQRELAASGCYPA